MHFPFCIRPQSFQMTPNPVWEPVSKNRPARAELARPTQFLQNRIRFSAENGQKLTQEQWTLCPCVVGKNTRTSNVDYLRENAVFDLMGRAGIEPATHGFSVPQKPRFSPHERGFMSMQIH